MLNSLVNCFVTAYRTLLYFVLNVPRLKVKLFLFAESCISLNNVSLFELRYVILSVLNCITFIYGYSFPKI